MDLHLKMTTRFWLAAALVIMASAFLALVSCSGKPKSKLEQAAESDAFKGWQWYQLDNFIIFYPPDHPHPEKMPEIARSYLKCIETVTKTLKMQPFKDTILFIYYQGPYTGQEATGQPYPYACDTAIHFWLPSFPGPVLMQYLIPYWSPVKTRHRFLYHGLISLFDFSGQKYHDLTVTYINQGKFIPLAKLAVDTTVNSNTERYQSAEAASFCAFVIGQKGPERLKDLYESPAPFDVAVGKEFKITVDSLQREWLYYLRQVVPADSIRDSLWPQ